MQSGHSSQGRQLWVMRHGNRLDFVQPAWFCTALYPYDPPLCPRGHRQAQDLGDRLQTETIHYICVSPFLRTLQTAQYCARTLKLPLKITPGLGEWQNRRWMSSAPKTHPITGLQPYYVTMDRETGGLTIPHYPESMAQVRRRSIQTLNCLLRRYSGNLLLIGHKVPLGICLSHLLGETEMTNLEVCALNQLIYMGDRWFWYRRNETDFLREPGIAVAPPELT